MPYQGGQRSAKNAPKAKGITWTPQFPGAGFLFGPGAFYAGRGANAAQQAPTDAELQAQGYRPLSEEFSAARRAPTDAELQAQGYRPLSEEFSAARRVQPGAKPKPSVQPTIIPAGIIQPSAIVTGLTPSGTVDYSQSDEYKNQLAQYQNLIKQEKQAEANDLGMKIWMEKYGKSPMAQAGGAIGAYNPLLATTFPETSGYAGTFATPEEVQMGDLGTRAQGETGPTMESLNPLATQAAQQAATAAQADKATTVKLPIRNRVQAFLYGGM